MSNTYKYIQICTNQEKKNKYKAELKKAYRNFYFQNICIYIC